MYGAEPLVCWASNETRGFIDVICTFLGEEFVTPERFGVMATVKMVKCEAGFYSPLYGLKNTD
jgi:hypothetical protein